MKEIITWKEIRFIRKMGDWFGGKGRGFPIYEVVYPKHKKTTFFMEGSIVSNRKTRLFVKTMAESTHAMCGIKKLAVVELSSIISI